MNTLVRAKPVVGQEVFVVMSNARSSQLTYQMRVIRVGRVWAELQRDEGVMSYRMSLATWQLDGQGYSSPGSVYESEAVYREGAALKAAWQKLRLGASDTRQPPPGVTIEHIQQALTLLGLDKEDE